MSWVTTANDHVNWTIHNLPFGIFSTATASPRAGVAIGDQILDLTAAATVRFSARSLCTGHTAHSAFLMRSHTKFCAAN